jgi:excisionase family DNA binding protein
MRAALDEEYVTIGQAADLLHVNKSTIRRWIAQDRLPAYRVGQRRIAVKRGDVARLITPAVSAMANGGRAASPDAESVRRLTPEEQERGLAAIEDLQRLHQELDAKYGRQLSAPSWKLLQTARGERSQQLR